MELVTMYYCDCCLDTFKTQVESYRHITLIHNGSGNYHEVDLETEVDNMNELIADFMLETCRCGDIISRHLYETRPDVSLFTWYCTDEIYHRGLY